MAERNLKSTLTDLFSARHLLSAPQILDILQALGRKYNKTSVYRALDQLEAEGIICKQFFTQNEAMYELKEHHHAHLVCKKCGKIEQTECDYHEPKELHGFSVDHHRVTLIGFCGNCHRS